MLSRILAACLLLSSCAIVQAAAPRYATPLQPYSAVTDVGGEQRRLRISIATESGLDERAVRVGEIMLCSVAACFKTGAPGYLDVVSTAHGGATLVADVFLPNVAITNVYFADGGGGRATEGELALRTPLIVENDYYGKELMLSLRLVRIAGQERFIPVDAASNYFNRESETVFYQPNSLTVAKLSFATTFSIPAHALSRPQVFSVGIHNVGEKYPKVDIYPPVALSKPATVIISAIPLKPRLSTGSDDSSVPRIGRYGAIDLSQGRGTGSVKAVTLKINVTGILEPAISENVEKSSVTQGVPLSAAQSSMTCAQYLAQPLIIGLINLMAAQTGAVRILPCEKIPPFIHMVYINTADPRIKYFIPYTLGKDSGNNGPTLALTKISSFPSSLVAINGFTWSGDKGIIPGGIGKADGIVRSAGVALGDNILGGGTQCSTCKLDNTQFVMAYSSDKANPAFFTATNVQDLGAYTNNVVSSTTSVVKSGSCNTPGGTNRWSAAGASNGRMLLVSSTTSGVTTGADLCAVFKALLINNAVRLDGGPSASMIVGGNILNPLEGLDYLKYGSMRPIAYPLAIGH